MTRYSRESIEDEFSQWCRGVIGRKTMTQNKYNALKKRCLRAGLRKGVGDFHISTKLPHSEYITARKRYHREWRRKRAAKLLSSRV
jgi:hypothetical protein